eukprot:TRINITY_DN6980_c0_g3_i3.p2 TRINITY_DN6980_c0_g3~~TRINITY_DN6980_c0_g3_i3.p2  ORF type:complete len:137 (-),score=12.20 TRINITY_DN6980_c0_g3_i3:505-864(-)
MSASTSLSPVVSGHSAPPSGPTPLDTFKELLGDKYEGLRGVATEEMMPKLLDQQGFESDVLIRLELTKALRMDGPEGWFKGNIIVVINLLSNHPTYSSCHLFIYFYQLSYDSAHIYVLL